MAFLELLEGAGPVVVEQAAQRPVGEEAAEYAVAPEEHDEQVVLDAALGVVAELSPRQIDVLLRKRAGAAGFAAAWDAAMGLTHRPVNLGQAKSTGLPAHYRMRAGLMQVLVHAGCFAGVTKKPDNCALLQHIAQPDRHLAAEQMEAWGG